MGTPLPPPQGRVGRLAPIFGPCLLRPNGWMDKGGTWHGGRPQPRRVCVRWGPSSFPPKGGGAPSPIFGPFLFWPNGSMHQNATWYGARPRHRRLCVKWGPRSHLPKGGWGGSPQFSAHVYCGQTAGWIKLVLAMEVGLSPDDFVLDGDPAPFPKRGRSPLQFSAHFYCDQMAGCIKMPLGTDVGLSPVDLF